MKQSFSIHRRYVAAIPRATLETKKNIAGYYVAGSSAAYGNQKPLFCRDDHVTLFILYLPFAVYIFS